MKSYLKEKLRRLLQELVFLVGTTILSVLVIILILAVSGCERRELYVYGDEFHSLTLNVDWHKYAGKNPDGMTVWFWPRETADETVPDSLAQWGKPYRFTTANVMHYDLYLHSGCYHAAVIDYSPEEYSRQEFLDMDDIMKARVVAVSEAHQPESDTLAQKLYGHEAYGKVLPDTLQATGLFRVTCQPEEMGLDTLRNMTVQAGQYGDYIPYGERQNYQKQLQVKEFKAMPLSPVWQLRLRLPVKGISNIWKIEASLAGMADGHYLALGRNTDTPCLIYIDEWDVVKTDNAGNGYVEATVRTFGLRPSARQTAASRHTNRSRALVIDDASEIRLNLLFTLRDRVTTCTYHYDLGKHVEEFEDELVLRLWLTEDDIKNDPDLADQSIDLPYVDAYEGAGFGADVTEWEDGQDAEVEM